MSIVHIDRSRVSDYEKCPRLRYWRYHYNGTGLEPSGEASLKLDARIGTWVHWGIEKWLDPPSPSAALMAISAEAGFNNECRALVEWDSLNTEQKFQITEAGRIVKALVYAWCRVRGPLLLQEGEVLALEQEIDVDFPVGNDTVRLMARPDVIYRRKTDGEVFIRNIKTVRKPNTTWREQWGLDMQTLSEPLAVDKWLGRDKCSGVNIDGLLTGEVLEYPKGTGHYYHNTPLLYSWCKKGIGNDPPFEVPDVWFSRYEWTCAGPHKLGNGRLCGGGETHRLSGVTKEDIETRYPGGVIGWIDYLLENDRSLVEEQLVELPPILRSEWHIERWKRMTLQREVRINEDAKLLNFIHDCKIDEPTQPGDPMPFDQTLDYKFPMHTSSGNCLRPGKCTFFDCCFGSSGEAPLQAGYVRREPNHPQEVTEE